MDFTRLRAEWFGNVRGDLLAGLVVALALIPEAIAFSIIAGVDPKVGLYASFSIAVIIAFAGGRPGMISASTAAMAILIFLAQVPELTGVPELTYPAHPVAEHEDQEQAGAQRRQPPAATGLHVARPRR